MTQFTNVSAALDGHLASMPGLPDVAWPNKDFEPAAQPYLRPSWLPSPTVQATMGATGEDRSIGVYQIDAFTAIGEGKKNGLDLADAVATYFKRGITLTHGTATVRVLSASIEAARRDGARWHTPVIIRYRANMPAR